MSGHTPPYTPFRAWILGEIADVGEAPTSDKRVDLVSFAGSDIVGMAIQAQGAPTLKRMLLELGSFTIHAGQGCALLTPHLVSAGRLTHSVMMLDIRLSYVEDAANRRETTS